MTEYKVINYSLITLNKINLNWRIEMIEINKKKIDETRKKNLASIKEKLTAYTKFIESNYSETNNEINWGDIGDMNRIDEHLSELEFVFDN